MCGGRGRRLGEITDERPKPLVEVGGDAILKIKMKEYVRQGFQDFVLCTGYKSNLIEQAVESFELSANVRYSNAGENAGILKRLAKAKEFIGDLCILTYGDTYSHMSLENLVQSHKASENEATIVVAPIQNPFGLVEFGPDNQLTAFREKPVLNYYIGYAVLNRSSLEYAPEKVIEMPDGVGLVTFFKILMALEKIGIYYYSGNQITFNTREELDKAREKISEFYTVDENRI